MPSSIGLGGVVVLSMASSYLVFYLLGGAWSVVAAPATFALVVVAQQVWPRSAWVRELPTGTNWHTNWWLVMLPVIAVLCLSWRRRGLPAGSGR
ncbi:MAG: hypothetical protein ACRCXL_11065 [Dermatophilaceae bacterium]